MHDVMVALFIMTVGMTTSGIIANLYRLIPLKSKEPGGRATYFAVMVVAGPSVLFDNAAQACRKKECSQIAFWLAAAVAAYWSLAIGMFVIELALAL